jgi:hypothetical protein
MLAEAGRLAGVAGPALTAALLSGCFSPAVAPGPDGTARAWTIQEPGDYLGILPGTPYAFDGVVAAIFLDSLVIVADEGTRQVHAFSVRNRTRVWSRGGQGSRPGQFELLADVDRASAGRLVALDAHLDRLTIFDAAGELEAMVPLDLAPPDVEYTRVVGFCDGSFAIATQESGASWSEPGIRRGESDYYRVDAGGALLNVLGRFPGEARLVTSEPRMIGSVPFGMRTMVAGDCKSLFVAEGSRFEVAAVRPDGSRGRSVAPAELPPQRVSSRDLAIYRRQIFLHVVPEALDGPMRQHLAQLDAPESFPAHRHLLVDTGGLIWLEEFPAGRSRVTRWFISDASGTPVATLHVDPRIRLVAVWHDRVLGVETMPDGRERAALFALTRWNR